jgi:5-methylcytosine-specific restriction protein A
LSSVKTGCNTCFVNRVIPTYDNEELESKVSKLINAGQDVKPKGNTKPRKSHSYASSFLRDPQVTAWVRSRANGICELCNNVAPFSNKFGDPYLEVHHIKFLAQGGKDIIENCVALCPNCHREAHHSKNIKKVALKLEKITEQ